MAFKTRSKKPSVGTVRTPSRNTRISECPTGIALLTREGTFSVSYQSILKSKSKISQGKIEKRVDTAASCKHMIKVNRLLIRALTRKSLWHLSRSRRFLAMVPLVQSSKLELDLLSQDTKSSASRSTFSTR